MAAVKCDDCNVLYNDASSWTYCPHDALMSDESLKRKDLGIELLGQLVLIEEEQYRVSSVTWDGFVHLFGHSGLFDPSNLKRISHLKAVK